MTKAEIGQQAQTLVDRWRVLQGMRQWGLAETMENAAITVKLAALWERWERAQN